MSRVGRRPIDVPKGVKVDGAEGKFTAEGPKGRVTPGAPARVSRSRSRAAVVTVGRSGDTGPERAKHGLMRALLANAVVGVSEGLQPRTRDHRRRLQGGAPRQRGSLRARLLAPGGLQGSAKESRSRSTRRTRSWSPERIVSSSARSAPRSAACGRPIRTRARASSSPTKSFVARSARPAPSKARAKAGRGARCRIWYARRSWKKRRAKKRAHQRLRQRLAGTAGASAAVGLQELEVRLRAGDQRRDRPDDGVGHVARAGAEGADRGRRGDHGGRQGRRRGRGGARGTTSRT